MANYINAYANQAAYDADTTKQYPNVSLLRDSGTIVHVKEAAHDYSNDYFTFVAEETFSFRLAGDIDELYYSIDGGETWEELWYPSYSPSLQPGESIMLKGLLTAGSSVGTFRMSGGKVSVEGNVMSLIYGDNFSGQTSLAGKDYAFNHLFQGCEGLTNAENLVLPATTLANYCYNGMFYDCTSLTTAPALPATTLAEGCYNSMFQGCTSLNSITCLATNISASECLNNWVMSVAANGTFTKAATMTNWTSGENGIPRNWTVQDYQA